MEILKRRRSSTSGGSAAAVQSILDSAGLRLNGPKPEDPQIHDERFYRRVLSEGSLGLGESYMDGWWDCRALDDFFYHALCARLDKVGRMPLSALWYIFLTYVWNLERKSRAFQVAEKHYDLGNSLFERMLDQRMVYSCGYWKDADTLDGAQEAKLDLICQKLDLEAGMTLLDVGCGWGSLVTYAAENYGARATGVTISKEQAAWARNSCENLPVEIRLMDYRDLDGAYDRIVSVGMFEHVGYKNYRTYMEIIHRCLNDGGLFLLHTIGDDVSSTRTDPWVHKYIFPNGMVPSTQQITTAAEGLFSMQDWHNFGPHYARTLLAWHRNFTDSWEAIKDDYDERFYRMWTYYLLSSAASFRARHNHLYQIAWTKVRDPRAYVSVR